MDLEFNQFKDKLRGSRRQVGFWLTTASGTVAEIIGDGGFDWVLIDAEHSPNELPSILDQVRILRATSTSAIVRPQICDPVIIKRLLDCGVQTLLVPMINSYEEASRAVAAIRYPPRGNRGVSMSQRANRFGRVRNYHARAEEQLCLILQIETLEAAGRLEEIAAVDGVDGLFIGPADLAADMGHVGEPRHPAVSDMIDSLAERGRMAGIPLGTLVATPEAGRRAFAQGMSFVAVGTDVSVLREATDQLLLETRMDVP